MEMCCGNGNGSRTKAVIGEGGLLKIKVYHLHASVQIGSFVSSKGFARFWGWEGVGGGLSTWECGSHSLSSTRRSAPVDNNVCQYDHDRMSPRGYRPRGYPGGGVQDGGDDYLCQRT